MGYAHYSEEFKRSGVEKFLSRGSRPAELIAQELGVSSHSLYKWARDYGTRPQMKKSERRPQDWTAAEKFKAVLEFEGLEASMRGEFLRREGLHSEHIESWKKSMQEGLAPAGRLTAEEKAEMRELKSRYKEMERDLRRKDKALAETTALLVLKKKADLIWGTRKDSEDDE